MMCSRYPTDVIDCNSDLWDIVCFRYGTFNTKFRSCFLPRAGNTWNIFLNSSEKIMSLTPDLAEKLDLPLTDLRS